MELIYSGLEKRIVEVGVLSGLDEVVNKASEIFEKYLNELSPALDGNTTLIYLLEAITNLRFAEVEAGYRMGLADGMQLQQEINSLSQGGKCQ